jgi:hypothetical protein
MTTDQWVQIFDTVAVVGATILGPIIAVRLSQPKPKSEATSPKNFPRPPRLLMSPWFLPGLVVCVNIFGLYRNMHSAAVTPRLVLSISLETATTALALTLAFLLNISRLLGKMIDSHGRLSDSVGSLIGVVKDVAQATMDNPRDEIPLP